MTLAFHQLHSSASSALAASQPLSKAFPHRDGATPSPAQPPACWLAGWPAGHCLASHPGSGAMDGEASRLDGCCDGGEQSQAGRGRGNSHRRHCWEGGAARGADKKGFVNNACLHPTSKDSSRRILTSRRSKSFLRSGGGDGRQKLKGM